MDKLSSTFQDYKKNYKSRLLAYLEEYADNTPDLFLEDELKTYNAFHNELKFIVDNFDKNFEEEINEGLNKQLYLSVIDGFIKSQHKFKPITKPSIPQSVLNYVLQSISNTKPKTISKVKNIPIPQYTEEDLNKMLKESWGSECNEDYIKSNIKKIYNNIITSTKRILDFIKDKQESMVPREEIVAVKDEPKPEKPENPYPTIFKSYEAFLIFDKLKTEFGNTETPLKNYSFVFRKMVIDNLIFPNLKHVEFREFLEGFDIYIERINTLGEIGNLKYRESIYSSVK
jgi:hypothetical protein